MNALNYCGKLRKWSLFAVGAVLVIVLAVAGFAQQGKGRPGGGGGGHESEEAVGNNLSTPVIWSDGVGIPLRGTFGTELWGETDVVWIDGTAWYKQQSPENEWQAETTGFPVLARSLVNEIDWGDNLEAKPWTDKSIVRAEVVLWKDLGENTMLGYQMMHLDGLGIDEMWGTNRVTYDSQKATVYAACARFVIQKFEDEVAPEDADVYWNDISKQWVNVDTGQFHIRDPYFNSAVYEGGGEGPDSGYSAEINVQGKVIYGYNWNVPAMPDEEGGPGYYRLTFSLDNTALNGLPLPLPFSCQTFFDSSTIVTPSAEESSVLSVQAEPEGGKAKVVPLYNLTYIDVQIIPAKGKGGPGGKKR